MSFSHITKNRHSKSMNNFVLAGLISQQENWKYHGQSQIYYIA